VLVVDETGFLKTGFLKKGTKSVGVARQYSGTAGRIENCQIGVFLGYASTQGQALIDRDLYLPKAWTADRRRCAAAAVPADVAFTIKPELARRMIERALAARVPFAWVVGDEVYGNDRRLRMWLEQTEQPHVLAIRATEPLWAWVDGQGPRQVAAEDLVAGVGGHALATPECRLWCQRGALVRLGAGAPVPPATAALGALGGGPPQPRQARGDRLLCRVRAFGHAACDPGAGGGAALDHRDLL
jgi:hypothetical protein